MKTTRARVPLNWYNDKRAVARALGMTTPKAIKLCDNVYAELIKKLKRKGRREIDLKVKL